MVIDQQIFMIMGLPSNQRLKSPPAAQNHSNTQIPPRLISRAAQKDSPFGSPLAVIQFHTVKASNDASRIREHRLLDSRLELTDRTQHG